MTKTREDLIQELEAMDYINKMRSKLPHLYQFKFYPWQRKFLEATNRFCILSAGNQIGKSHIQITKAIKWATSPKLWPSLWKKTPNLFWYLYPSRKDATSEFELKWKGLLPDESLKDHPIYGWTFKYKGQDIHYIKFNSGVRIEFRAYKQGKKALQGATVYALFCDEELPWDLEGELRLRLNANSGYFSMVATPTIGQDEWRRVIEPDPKNPEEEVWPEHEVDILKMKVSAYDCLEYEDGTETEVTVEKIKELEKSLTPKQIKVRIYGGFMKEDGLLFNGYDEQRNTSNPHPLPKDWNYFCGIDYGSGGKTGHNAGIVVVAVCPEYIKARVVWSWRSSGEDVTSGDILEKYKRSVLTRFKITRCFYDYSAADIGILAARHGISVETANKKREPGLNLLNTLFKHGALKIMTDEHTDNTLLLAELRSIPINAVKQSVEDTLSDSLRYALSKLNFQLEAIKKLDPKEEVKHVPKERTRWTDNGIYTQKEKDEIIDEISEINSMFDLEY
jgi:phage terminase large subunit-like protein